MGTSAIANANRSCVLACYKHILNRYRHPVHQDARFQLAAAIRANRNLPEDQASSCIDDMLALLGHANQPRYCSRPFLAWEAALAAKYQEHDVDDEWDGDPFLDPPGHSPKPSRKCDEWF